MTVLSYGGGVNSTALLLLKFKEIDALIFSDPGAELPRTYSYIDQYVKPFCELHKIDFITVKIEQDIYAAYDEQKSLPAIVRRSCTVKWKITPINKYLKKHWPGHKVMIGIDFGELHRARFNDPEKLYPLIDAEINRAGCVEIITDHGWPDPGKSGCFFCPFQSKRQWRDLYLEDRDLFERARDLEAQSKKFPQFTLMQQKPKRLDWFQRTIETQSTLDLGIEEPPQVHCGCYDG